MRGPSRTSLRLLLSIILLHATPDAAGDSVNEDMISSTNQHGVVVGNSGTIFSTTNGGYAWVPQRLYGDLTVDLKGVFVQDDSSAIAVGGDCGGVYGSSACGVFVRSETEAAISGVAWTKAGIRDGGSLGDNLRTLNAVTFCSNEVGLVVGSNGAVLRSSNFGASWGVVASGTQYDLYTVGCFSATEAIIAGVDVVIRSTDAGLTWLAPATPPDPSTHMTLLMRRSSFAIAMGNAAAATSDSGQTWAPVALNASLPANASYASAAEDAYYATALLSRTLPGGLSTVQLLRSGIVEGGILGAGATAMGWERREFGSLFRFEAESVALPGLGDDCPGCDTVMVAGRATTYARNKNCQAAIVTCDGSIQWPSVCCGPLQMQARRTEGFVTAVYPNASGVPVPVGCTDLITCVTLRAISFTSGIGVVERTPAPLPPPSPPPPVKVTLKFEVDISLNEVFQIRIFSDAIMEIALIQLGGSARVVQAGLHGPQRKVCSGYAAWFWVCDALARDLLSAVIAPEDAVIYNATAHPAGGVMRQIIITLTSGVYAVDTSEYGASLGVNSSLESVLDPEGDSLAMMFNASDPSVNVSATFRFNATRTVALLLTKARASPGISSPFCKAGAKRLRVESADGPDVDLEINCELEGLSFEATTALVAGLSTYYLAGILMAFFFSLPKNLILPKDLHTSYLLWFFFGFVGTHRFYLKQPRSGIVYLFTGGFFGIGWLFDMLLTQSLWQAATFDRGMEASGYVAQRVRNAVRPHFVTRREVLNIMSDKTLAQAETFKNPNQQESDKENEAAKASRVMLARMQRSTSNLAGGLGLRQPPTGSHHTSAILYPSTVAELNNLHARDERPENSLAGLNHEINYDQQGDLCIVV